MLVDFTDTPSWSQFLLYSPPCLITQKRTKHFRRREFILRLTTQNYTSHHALRSRTSFRYYLKTH